MSKAFYQAVLGAILFAFAGYLAFRAHQERRPIRVTDGVYSASEHDDTASSLCQLTEYVPDPVTDRQAIVVLGVTKAKAGREVTTSVTVAAKVKDRRGGTEKWVDQPLHVIGFDPDNPNMQGLQSLPTNDKSAVLFTKDKTLSEELYKEFISGKFVVTYLWGRGGNLVTFQIDSSDPPTVAAQFTFCVRKLGIIFPD